MLKDLYFDSKILGGGLVRHELCLIFFYTGVYNLDVSLFYCGKVMFAVLLFFDRMQVSTADKYDKP